MFIAPRHYVCPQCGYDLRGQTVDRCPECGFHYDLPALRHLEWQSFYARLIPYLQAAKILAPLGVILAGVSLAGSGLFNRRHSADCWFVAVFLAWLSIGFVEDRILGGSRRELHGPVRDAIVSRARMIVLCLAIADVLLLVLVSLKFAG
jgi:hypothetical protein